MIIDNSGEDKSQLNMSYDLLQERLKGFPSDKDLQSLYMELDVIKQRISIKLKD